MMEMMKTEKKEEKNSQSRSFTTIRMSESFKRRLRSTCHSLPLRHSSGEATIVRFSFVFFPALRGRSEPVCSKAVAGHELAGTTLGYINERNSTTFPVCCRGAGKASFSHYLQTESG